MAEVMLNSLIEELSEKEFPFVADPFYSDIGDFLSLSIKPDEAYDERVDDILTVYRSMDTDEIVGCKIKGVSLLAEHVVNFIKVEEGEFKLCLLLLNALGATPECKQHYYDLNEIAGTVTIPREMLIKMARSHSAAAV